MAEREFLDLNGTIPGRTWFKHVVYEPGLWVGYGATTFPSLTEAIDEVLRSSNWTSVEVAQLAKLAKRIQNVANVPAG